MKRGPLVILAVLLLFVILSVSVFAVETTGNSIQTVGKVTYAQINTSIFIVNVAPSINYLFPEENETYRNSSMYLNYSVYDPEGISMVWYNLDSKANISLGNSPSNAIHLNMSDGNHTLFFYVNDTLGVLNFSMVHFFMYDTRTIIIYNSFKTNTSGSTTNFDSLNQSQLENLSDMTLEHTTYGKIVWLERINLTNDSSPGDRVTVLDSNIIIGHEFIFVNATNLSNLDKSARLWFYNLNYANPRVLKEGVICPDSVCSNEVYSSGTLRVDVTGFSNYTLEETPEVPGSGGGGAPIETAGAAPGASFRLYLDEIGVSIKQGETKSDRLLVINNGSVDISVRLILQDIGELLRVNETEFNLSVGETKVIRLDFIALEDKKPGFYLGKITVRGGGIVREILIAIEIESKDSLFDVAIEIPPAFQRVYPGEDVVPFIKVYNLGATGRVDANVEYSLIDKSGNAITIEHETIAVETQASFVKEIKVPASAKPGDYFVYVKVIYNNQTASSSARFFVISRPFIHSSLFTYLLLMLIIILLVAIFVVIYFIFKSKSRAKKERRIDEYVLASKRLIKSKYGKKDLKLALQREDSREYCF
jgi:hypothetical protein